MEQAGTDRDGLRARGPRRRWPWLLIVGVVVLAVAVATSLIARPWENSPPTMRPAQPLTDVHSMSIDFGVVVDPDTDWSALDARLDAAGVNAVDLNAGRVEFTAFDWSDHPEAAAEPGTDHLARAARALNKTAEGQTRQIGLIVDAYAPRWIEEHPEAAGVAADGRRSVHQVSATELTEGVLGQRLVEYVAALCERYEPSQIAVTELFLSTFTFGSDDLDLFKEMTGRSDWPRTPDGAIDEDAPEIHAWRAEVIAGLLGRMRAAMDRVGGGAGRTVDLAMDVRVAWRDPAPGDLASGHDYEVLLREADQLVLWAYLYDTRQPAAIQRLTRRLARGGLDMSRLTVSVGLWGNGPLNDVRPPIAPSRMAAALEAAQTHGITAVNLTPVTLMTPRHWAALGAVWNPAPDQ